MKNSISSNRTQSALPAVMALACLSIMIAGCQPTLSFEKQYLLASGELLSLPIDAVSNEQTIHVSAVSNDGEKFTVHVYLKKDEQKAVAASTLGKTSDLILAASKPGTEANLSALIPANEATIVQITAQFKPVNVGIKINN